MYCSSQLHSECNLIAAVFINLRSVYIYLGTHGCMDLSSFIHMVFLKPYYSLCILSNKLLQMIYDKFLMIDFHTSLGGDFPAIHQSLSDYNNNFIINNSKKLHSHTKHSSQSRAETTSRMMLTLAQPHPQQPEKNGGHNITICQDYVFHF